MPNVLSNNAASPSTDVLRAGFAHSGMSRPQLHVEYFMLGGPLRSTRLDEILDGGPTATAREHDGIAAALNGWYIDEGLGHAVPYFDELVVGGDGGPLR
jgi:hypothetical protein